MSDKIRPDVTADWARKTSQEILSEKVKKEINYCLDTIVMAVKRNELSCSFNTTLDKLTIKNLENRGFKVDYHSGYDVREPAYHSVSW